MTDQGVELTEQEATVLEIEKLWWQYVGTKEQAIRERLAMSQTAYYQALNTMLDDPRVYAVDPITVKRLLRIRSDRQRTRSARRLGMDQVGP